MFITTTPTEFSPYLDPFEESAYDDSEPFSNEMPQLAADALNPFGEMSPGNSSPSMMQPMPPPLNPFFGPIGQLGSLFNGAFNRIIGGSRERYFQNANGASVGDPHLSFNGKSWNNMGSQPNLLDSDSMCGGYRLSTQATPLSGGVSYNQSATVSLDRGNTQITLANDGNASIEQDGNSFALQPDTAYDLGQGNMVMRDASGKVCVTALNGNGGQIDTTLSVDGQGVDVNVSANNVNLGGALVNGPSRYPWPVQLS